MSYRDHEYTSPSGTHPVGEHSRANGSAWGLAVVLVILVGVLALAMMAGPADNSGEGGATMPSTGQEIPAAPAAPAAPVQPVE